MDSWEVFAHGALGFASYFKMGFNRDDCLTMGGSVTCLWVANCCSLIRTRGASSCCVREFKTFALLERSALEAPFSRQRLQQFCEFAPPDTACLGTVSVC